MFPLQAFLILCLMVFGLYHRRCRKIHIPTMGTAIVWDILLILQIELSRGALAKVSQAAHNATILNIHVALAFGCVLGYLGLVATGCGLLGGRPWRPCHRKLGWSVFALRILVFATSFWAV